MDDKTIILRLFFTLPNCNGDPGSQKETEYVQEKIYSLIYSTLIYKGPPRCVDVTDITKCSLEQVGEVTKLK